jgi:hypothetical protein
VHNEKLSVHDAVIRVYDAAGNVIETHEHAGDFDKWRAHFFISRAVSSLPTSKLNETFRDAVSEIAKLFYTLAEYLGWRVSL